MKILESISFSHFLHQTLGQNFTYVTVSDFIQFPVTVIHNLSFCYLLHISKMLNILIAEYFVWEVIIFLKSFG